MADPNQLINDGMVFASQAIQHDQNGAHQLAHFFYVEASEAILKAISLDTNLSSAKSKALQYVARAEVLQSLARTSVARSSSQTDLQREVEQVQFLLSQALSEDEQGNHEMALSLYTDVIEHCLEKVKTVSDAVMKERLNNWAMGALDRAEAIKGTKDKPLQAVHPDSLGPPPPALDASFLDEAVSMNRLTLKQHFPAAPAAPAGPPHVSTASGSGKPRLTGKEIDTLKQTSYINGKVYPPWLDVDLREKFAYKIPFTDPDGVLALAPKQKQRFVEWVRPSDLCENPKMIYAVTSLSIKQTIVSDCSFVASLAISAAYEKHFKKKLITTIIYPQNRNGEPIINPCGKYMIKLRVNGVKRKVIIDDTLPMGKDGQLLCSYSQNKDEFWVSLLEKAYMKVMGGYDFPGSNSNIDLHALTGWIPERQNLKSTADKNVLFDRLVSGMQKGDVLVTAATGPMSQVEADRAGLVQTHAYAVLDMKHVQGKRLCQLKNPWSHLRWRGKYSEGDSESWNIELEKILRYNRHKAAERDDGVFWINWESVLNFYDVIYMNWNPNLFPYKFTYHAKWKAVEGPIKDAYNVGDNPQYSLEVQAGDQDSVVWLLLTRHITDRDDFAENKEFITLHVFKSDGKRVYYPDDKFMEGVKINSPHYLCKLKPARGTNRYTVVLSQYEKMNTILYSIKITVQWTKSTAGGSKNNPTYENNPKIPLELIADHPAQLLIKMEANRKFAVAAELRSTTSNFKKHSGDHRWGFLAFDLKDIPPGKYVIIPSTFIAGKEGPFFLEVNASCAFTLNNPR